MNNSEQPIVNHAAILALRVHSKCASRKGDTTLSLAKRRLRVICTPRNKFYQEKFCQVCLHEGNNNRVVEKNSQS